MGKRLNRQETGLSLENNEPGCMGGILHHFHNHHKRLHVKKRLPYKKHGAGKLSTATVIADHIIEGSTSEAAELQENIVSFIKNPVIETKLVEPVTLHKSSMKSRIKALFTEEMSKRRARHRRTASCPVRPQLERTHSFHHLGTSIPEPPDPNNEVIEYPDIAILDPLIAEVGKEHSRSDISCDLCAKMLTTDYLNQNMIKPPVLEMEPASIQDSKLFLEALDLLNMRKKLFLKVLKDPSSSLTHKLHSRKTSSNLRVGLTKSISFPAMLSKYGSFQKSEDESKVTSSKDPFTENGSLKNFPSEINVSENGSPSSDNMLTKRHDNKIAFKRFKNIREKIKHVIRDRKREKHRIIMDGVLHKVPYKRSKDMKEDKFSPRGSSRNDDCGKTLRSNLKRTLSFSEPINKYYRILEAITSKEEEENTCERLRFRTANTSPTHSHVMLGRIVSLPDFRYFQNEDSPSTSVGNRKISEEKLLGVVSENEVKTFYVSENGSPENFVGIEENLDDFKTKDILAPQPSELDLVFQNDTIDQEKKINQKLEIPILEDEDSSAINPDPDSISDSILDTYTPENQIQLLYNELFHIHVDNKNKSEYSYVKDVLELSGFSRNEILGQWHSIDHPVDPLVFEEVESNPLDQLEYSENGTCNHIFLFDLINEVLLNIYEKSFCYWPMPLSCQSRLHRMPIGCRVLEEVWSEINWFLSWKPENDESIDDAVGRDLEKGYTWMNLQFDAECVGLEVEDLIFDDLLEEIIFS